MEIKHVADSYLECQLQLCWIIFPDPLERIVVLSVHRLHVLRTWIISTLKKCDFLILDE